MQCELGRMLHAYVALALQDEGVHLGRLGRYLGVQCRLPNTEDALLAKFGTSLHVHLSDLHRC